MEKKGAALLIAGFALFGSLTGAASAAADDGTDGTRVTSVGDGTDGTRVTSVGNGTDGRDF